MDTGVQAPPPFLIGVDWGTSVMRAILLRVDASAEDEPEVVTGPGVAAARGAFAEALLTAIKPWTAAHGKLPVVMSGMIGSNIGWQAVPYVECPFSPPSLRTAMKSFDLSGQRLSIVPGLSCRNALGTADFMRGEELQILGWLERAPERKEGEHVLCLPGTHTKWVRLAGGRVETFMTALSGEVYSLLRDHSILLPDGAGATAAPLDESAFAEGLALAQRSGGDLLHTLFSVRSRQIGTPRDAANSSSYLSGLVIGTDVMCGLARFEPREGIVESMVELVGDAALCRKFASALESLGVGANLTDGIDAACRGFRFLAESRP